MKKLLLLLLSIPTFSQAAAPGKPPKSGAGVYVAGDGNPVPNKIEIPAQLAPIAGGDLNRSFGVNGVTRDISATSSFYAMVKDSSGNMYVCGFGNNSTYRAWIVAKYTSAGVIVSGWGTSGDGYTQEDSISTTNQNSEAFGLTLTPDETGLIVVGYSIPSSTTKIWTVIKYVSSSGARDNTFGTLGLIQETELGAGTAYSVSIDSTGTYLYAGGYTTPSSATVITTISYANSNGARNANYNP